MLIGDICVTLCSNVLMKLTNDAVLQSMAASLYRYGSIWTLGAVFKEIPFVRICMQRTGNAPIPKGPVCAAPASYKKSTQNC